MNKLVNYTSKGRGHFKVTAEINGERLSTVTTNTMAIDAAFDDCYDDKDNEGRYYETRQEAIDALIGEIERNN